MTELMKRYEAEFEKGLTHACYESWLEYQVLDGKTIEKFQEIIRTQCDEISALKAQLTWRPVTQKPEKDGEYFAKHDASDEPSVLSYKDGVWIFFDYDIAENVITNPPLYWLPIPPAGEGEC